MSQYSHEMDIAFEDEIALDSHYRIVGVLAMVWLNMTLKR